MRTKLFIRPSQTTILALLVAVTLITVTGCASILSGTEDNVSVNSLVEDTVILVDATPRGKNAASLTLQRGKSHIITAIKNGCQDVTITTGQQFDYRSLLGIFIDFGLISVPIDFVSGAAMKTMPTTYTVSPICDNQ